MPNSFRRRATAARRLPTLGLAALLLTLCLPAAAHRSEPDVTEPDLEYDAGEFEPVRVGGPFAFPWSLGFLPDGSMLVTERTGRLHLLRPEGEAQMVAGLPGLFSNTGEGHAGLLDVAVDPRFADNATIYLSYVHGDRDRSLLRVLRARLDPAQPVLSDGAILFESSPGEKSEIYGGRIAVSRDGHLFIALGDRWMRERAQDLSDPAGSILRIRTDGGVPLDNPFAARPGARPEIWSYGHRNPLGLAFDPQGRLWSHENGPQGGDELNLIKPGANYGWPVVSHGVEYAAPPPNERKGPTTIVGVAKEGMEPPVHHWTPSVAPSGLAVEATGEGLTFWIGGLAARALIRLDMRDGAVVAEERLLEGEVGRIRDVRIGPDGAVYLLTDGPQGVLYRLDPVIEQAVKRRPHRRM